MKIRGVFRENDRRADTADLVTLSATFLTSNPAASSV